MDVLIYIWEIFHLTDLVDIFLLAFIIYRGLVLIKGTRTIFMVVGISVSLGAAYVLTTMLRLEAMGWLLENLVSSLVVIVVILFQSDIRNAIAQVGLTTLFRDQTATSKEDLIDQVVSTAFALAPKRIGALIVMETEAGLRDLIDRGKLVGGRPSVELFEAIFHTKSPLHDGAVIIDKAGRLAAAGCILPLSSNLTHHARFGTRHRAALGVTEESDAVVVVVSEERGQVSLAHQGQLQQNLEKTALRKKLTDIFKPAPEQASGTTHSNPAGG